MCDLRGRVASEQEGHAAMQRAMAADKEDITKQGAALVDMGKQVLYQGSCLARHEPMQLHRHSASWREVHTLSL